MDSTDSTINGNFTDKDILSTLQFSKKDIALVFKTADKMKNLVLTKGGSDLLRGKLMTALFYEPSSRTFGSFVAAMQRLGGGFIPLQGMTNSSVAKGETLEDTIRVFESYSDVIVIRDANVGTAQKAANAAKIPVLNAGDGIGEHPTQALLDLYTIYGKHKKLDKLTGVIAGDLLNGRTVHSLLKGLCLFKGITLYLLSPKELQLSREDFAYFKKHGLTLIEITNDKDMPENADFWYWTRVQKERFASAKAYEKVKNKFIVTPELVKEKAGKKTIILHPLPRIGEIDPAVDSDERAVYLPTQTRNGMYVRMALLALVLGKV